ncbi:hypothetical protein CV102_02470 [Natronococcus pandeyae]|uniref:Uncharacterized protein n=1 Tax=Natronococcus pandeyae TaxID=2055836 RepID=A0A8J8Q8H0_9EURY|nr:hypothetical protein [Natronococcus pandeyae]TYL40458.1 hypothetical protein CV102_02470 [Natronococcus pandeyae]
MRELPVDLDEDTLEALEAERRLIGFENRAAYVRWIVDHRGSISGGSDEDNELLEAYRQRIDELERRLEDLESAAHSSESGEAVGEDADLDEDTDAESDSSDERSDSRSEGERSDQDDAWRRWGQDPTIEVRGGPQRTVRRAVADEQPAEATDGGSPAEATSGSSTVQMSETDRPAPAETDGQQQREDDSRPPADADSAPLTPERVVRVAEDPVAADADVLESVEVERLDEFSRRAVAKTRERLDRDVETGLDYRSTPPLTNEDVRPGADLVDLEALSVPGRSEEQLARRRAVAGRALAFLRDERQARKADFVEGFYETSPAGYATSESWWSFLKAVFRQVETVDGGDGARTWRYTG